MKIITHLTEIDLYNSSHKYSMTLTPAYLVCSRDYRSYLIFRLIINPLFESKQAPFSSQYGSHLHHHHRRNEKPEEIFERKSHREQSDCS